MPSAQLYWDAGRVSTDSSAENIISAANPDDIRAFATEQTTAANNYLIRLADVASGLAAPTIEPVFPAGAVS